MLQAFSLTKGLEAVTPPTWARELFTGDRMARFVGHTRLRAGMQVGAVQYLAWRGSCLRTWL